jgi:Spy/CpxP family protein refolding chaperone
MTRRCAAYLVVLGVLVFAVPVFGQASPGMGGGRRGGWGGGQGNHEMPSVDDQVKELTKQLKLTDDQQPKVRDLLQKQQDQRKQVMQDTSIARGDKRSKMHAIHETTTGKIRDLLNDEQKKKYDDYLQKQQQNREGHRGRGMGPES